MARIRLWMRMVGGFYVAVGLFNAPFVVEARFSAQYPDLAVSPASPAAQALVDVWFMFGLEVLVIGAALLWFSREPQFSRDPRRHLPLVWTVIGLELVRGVVDDLYLIARGYDLTIYLGWIALHLIIIVTGLLAVRGGRPAATDEPSPATASSRAAGGGD